MTDTEKRDSIIQKVIKLMELGNANNNENSHQVEAAKKKVAQLMADYSIEFVHLKQVHKDADPYIEIKVYGSEPKKVTTESSLANHIARAFDCKCINTYVKDLDSEKAFGYWQIGFVGAKSDLEIVIYFFKYLRRTVAMTANRTITRESLTANNSGKVMLEQARKEFRYGMVMTIGDRLEDLFQRKEELIPSDCRALMIVKKDGLDKAFKEMYPNARTTRNSFVTSGSLSSFNKGQLAGKKVNLSRPIGNNSKAAGQIG